MRYKDMDSIIHFPYFHNTQPLYHRNIRLIISRLYQIPRVRRITKP